MLSVWSVVENRRRRALRRVERPADVAGQVAGAFQADAHPHPALGQADLQPLRLRHRTVGGGAWVRGHRLGVAEEPLGLLTIVGTQIHWATPGHGQAKPIERAFRDLTEIVSMHPACAGAYTGNNPLAKPEDYGKRAIPLAEFERLIAWGMAEYNAREGRTTENARGRSFNETFAASLAAGAPVGRAAPEQLKLALLAADNLRCNSKTGEINLYGNGYYNPVLYGYAGQKVTVRFDPSDLQSEIHVYKTTGEFICSAKVSAAVGFYDVDGSKARAKMVADLRKSTREAERLQGLISAADLAAMRGDAEASEPTEPQVVRPVRPRGNGRQALAALPSPTNDRAPFMDRFTAAMSEASKPDERPTFTILDGGLKPRGKR